MATHNSFRGALAAASTRIEENIMTSAIGELKERSEEAVKKLRLSYQIFFDLLVDAITDPGVSGDTFDLPSQFWGLKNSPGSWMELSPKWMKRKERAVAPDAFLMYRGLTEGVHTGMRGRKNPGKIGAVKKGKGPSFKQHLETLAADPGSTSRIFGDPKIGYALIRPDGGKVSIYQNKDVLGGIGKIQQHQGGTGYFAKALDGTKLQAQLWAFPKLEGLLPEANAAGVRTLAVEDRVARFVGRSDPGGENQWVKIYGKRRGTRWRLRPLITPMIQWYLQVEFERILKGLTK